MILVEKDGIEVMRLLARKLLEVTQKISPQLEDSILESIFDLVKECPSFEIRNFLLLSLVEGILSYQVPDNVRIELEKFADCVHCF